MKVKLKARVVDEMTNEEKVFCSKCDWFLDPGFCFQPQIYHHHTSLRPSSPIYPEHIIEYNYPGNCNYVNKNNQCKLFKPRTLYTIFIRSFWWTLLELVYKYK